MDVEDEPLFAVNPGTHSVSRGEAAIGGAPATIEIAGQRINALQSLFVCRGCGRIPTRPLWVLGTSTPAMDPYTHECGHVCPTAEESGLL